MGVVSEPTSQRIHDGAAYVVRNGAPMLAVLAIPAAIVLAIAILATPVAEPGPVPAAQPSDGFRFEQVGVGVKRFIDDGAGHRPGDPFAWMRLDHELIAFEPDGSVLMSRERADLEFDLTFDPRPRLEIYRLGQKQSLARSDEECPDLENVTDMAVAPDGAVWAAGDGLASLDAGGWTVWRRKGQTHMIEVAQDGTVWADTSGRSLRITRIQDGGRRAFAADSGLPRITREWDARASGITTAPDGSVWVGVGATVAGRRGGLLHYDGERWKVVRPLGRGVDAGVEAVAASPDGTVWVYLSRDARKAAGNKRSASYLASFDGTTWTVFDADDGIPQHAARRRSNDDRVLMRAGADGTVWLAAPTRGRCGRLVTLDEGIATSPLDEATCVRELEVDADGTAWVLVEWPGPEGDHDWSTELYLVAT